MQNEYNKDGNSTGLIEAEDIKKRLGKNTYENHINKILMTQITTIVWLLT